MGRPEMPLDCRPPAMRALAQRLRVQRAQAKLTLDELARRCPVSKATLSRVGNGRSLPTLRTVEAWGRACEVHEKEADITKRLWLKARSATKGSGSRVELDLVHDFHELRQAMLALRARAGSPSLREIARLSPDHARLSKTTVRDLLLGTRRPRLQQLTAFVAACGISGGQMREWVAAWEAAEAHRNGRPRGYGYAIQTCPAARLSQQARIVGQQRGPTWKDLEVDGQQGTPRRRGMAPRLKELSP